MTLVAGLAWAAEDRSADELLAQARQAFAADRGDEALVLVGRALEREPKNVRAYFLRGMVQESLQHHVEAVADFDQAIELDPRQAAAYDHRGSEQFKLGRIAESIADFDKAIELQPALERGHWKRGISCYYAGRYEDGRRQFERYQTVDDNDVENAVWRYLCMARSDGVDRARREILKIKNDRRVPMMSIYALYAGKAKPEDVAAAVAGGEPAPEELNRRQFYAELYLGLYYEAAGDEQQARRHIDEATKHPIPHYMSDVARVHFERLKSSP